MCAVGAALIHADRQTEAQKDVPAKDNRHFPRLRTVPKSHKNI